VCCEQRAGGRAVVGAQMQRGARRGRKPARCIRMCRMRKCATCVLRAVLLQAGEPGGARVRLVTQGTAAATHSGAENAAQRTPRTTTTGIRQAVRAHTLRTPAAHNGRVTKVAGVRARLHRCSATSCQRGARTPRHARDHRRTRYALLLRRGSARGAQRAERLLWPRHCHTTERATADVRRRE
jgi:hypothetical protein